MQNPAPWYCPTQFLPHAQFPPHHFVTLSEPHSSYRALVTAYLPKSSVPLSLAIPLHASRAGSLATLTTTSAPGSRTSLIAPCTRVASPGKLAGEPVRKTFCRTPQKTGVALQYPDCVACRGRARGSLTFAILNRCSGLNFPSTNVIASPRPPLSTPAIPGENHTSGTLQRSTFRCILACPRASISE